MSKVIKSDPIRIGDEHLIEFWKHDNTGIEEVLLNDVQLCWIDQVDKTQFIEELKIVIERYKIPF